jgi:hypothetical protein
MAIETMTPNEAHIMRGGTRLFVRRTGDDAKLGWIPLGKIDPVGIAPSVKRDELYDGYSGSRRLFKARATTEKIEFTVTCYERTKEILRAWLQGGAASTVTQDAGEVDGEDNKNITDLLEDLTAVTDILPNKAYKIYDGAGNHIHHLDPDTPVTIVDLVEGTDFVVDYVAGFITFAAAQTVDAEMTVKWKASSETTFDLFSDEGIAIEAKGVHVLEDGGRVERWTIPSARLEPGGDGKVDFENETKLELKLIQLWHATLGWGTYSISEP